MTFRSRVGDLSSVPQQTASPPGRSPQVRSQPEASAVNGPAGRSPSLPQQTGSRAAVSPQACLRPTVIYVKAPSGGRTWP